MRTVFVIGAGANVEIGMPSGDELKNEIAKLLNFSIKFDRLVEGNGLMYSAIQEYIRRDTNKAQNVWNATRNISMAMPFSISIDNYIEAQRGNQEIELCGKLAIVHSIRQAEYRCAMYDSFSDDVVNRLNSKLNDSWYPSLFKKITEGCHIDDLAERLHNISFIIFNYDRCFEYFMYNALMIYYNIDSEKAKEIVQQLHINHPYGIVGNLWDNENRLTFGKIPTSADLITLAQTIKTFTESVDLDSEKESCDRIQYLVEHANRIVFLGFAYHDQNVNLLLTHKDILNVMDEVPASNVIICYGTGYGMSGKDLQHVCQVLKAKNTLIKDCDILPITCSQFFYDFSYRLSFKQVMYQDDIQLLSFVWDMP